MLVLHLIIIFQITGFNRLNCLVEVSRKPFTSEISFSGLHCQFRLRDMFQEHNISGLQTAIDMLQ